MEFKDFYDPINFTNVTPISEDYPSTWNKDEFEKITSFNAKMKYAITHLKKIASGSGRTVFQIDDKKVLKLAKNEKGLAQNGVEAEPYIQNYDITTHVFDRDEKEVKDIGPFWIESELATKLTRKRFEQLTSVRLNDLDFYLRMVLARSKTYLKMDPAKKEELDNNEFVMDILRFAGDYGMPPGDLGRLSSYGEVVRDGKPKVVLVDYGLTDSVWNDYYKR